MTNFRYALTPDDRLCFVHIGKTGGLTLRPLLDQMFDPKEICPADDRSIIIEMSSEELARYRLFRGHYVYDIGNLLPENPIYITMLRHPIIRARSVYQHIFRSPANPRHELVKSLTFEEYVFAEPHVRIDIDNFQTRVLTSTLSPKKQPDLELAKKRLQEDFKWVGLTERYDDSLVLLSYIFHWPVAVKYEKRNTSPNPFAVPQNLIDRIIELNQLDLALYEVAQQHFQERFNAMLDDGISPIQTDQGTETINSTLHRFQHRIDQIFENAQFQIDGIFHKK